MQKYKRIECRARGYGVCSISIQAAYYIVSCKTRGGEMYDEYYVPFWSVSNYSKRVEVWQRLEMLYGRESQNNKKRKKFSFFG